MKGAETIRCMRLKQYRSSQRAVPRERRYRCQRPVCQAPFYFSHAFCLNKVPDNILPPSPFFSPRHIPLVPLVPPFLRIVFFLSTWSVRTV